MYLNLSSSDGEYMNWMESVEDMIYAKALPVERGVMFMDGHDTRVLAYQIAGEVMNAINSERPTESLANQWQCLLRRTAQPVIGLAGNFKRAYDVIMMPKW